MCNKVFTNGKKISKEGIGFKLFTVSKLPTERLVSWHIGQDYIVHQEDGEWITWRGVENEGFCFFTSFVELKKYIKTHGLTKIGTEKIRVIMYKGGIQSKVDMSFSGHGIRTALCKSFKIL